jgi:hypothetical protein
MTNTKARRERDLIDEVIGLKRDKAKQYGRARQDASVSSAQGVPLGGSGKKGSSDSNANNDTYLSTIGGTMMGPIAFYLASATIASGVIDISKESGNYSSRMLVIGEGASADDLEVILNASFAGQILFFQPIQAITLQSYLKTATAWSSSSVSYSIGDVVLYSSQRYTCYVAHTSSGSILPTDATKWHRNNIRITGTTERVVAIDEIIMLQYDSTDSVWTVISGGGTSGGASGWVGTAASDLNMNTWDITNMDRIFFSSNTDFFTNTDNVLLRDNNGFNWNLSDNTDTHSFYFTGAKEFEITNTQITTNNVIPDTGGTYTVGTASDTYLEGYFTRVKDVQNLQGDGVNLMKVIFDEGLDSDTYITGTLTSPRDRINHVVNGINTQWWVEDSSGNKEIGMASGNDIQFNISDNWMHIKGRTVVNPSVNSTGNLFFDSSDDTLKIRKKNASGVLSTVSLEGGGTGMQNPATASLDMASETIVDIDWLTFDSVSTPAVANIAIYTDSVDILVKKASGAGVNLTSGFANGDATGNLDMATNDIERVGQIEFSSTSHYIKSNSVGFEYRVPVGDDHEFFVNGVSECKIDGGTTYFNNNVHLGSSSADVTTHNGLVNYAANYSAVGLPAATSAGYITIQVGGVAKKLYYYS